MLTYLTYKKTLHEVTSHRKSFYLTTNYHKSPSRRQVKTMSPNYNSTSTQSQRNRILDYLRYKSLTTLAGRTELDIMHPAARIQELREQGYEIFTHWETVDSGQGKHRVASYVLLSGDANG